MGWEKEQSEVTEQTKPLGEETRDSPGEENIHREHGKRAGGG